MRGLGFLSQVTRGFAIQGRAQPWSHGALSEGDDRDRSKCGSQASSGWSDPEKRDRDIDRGGLKQRGAERAEENWPNLWHTMD